MTAARRDVATEAPDDLDRRLIAATEAGLPLDPRPYHALAGAMGVDAETVMTRLRRLQDRRIIRRIAAVPNHYALGYRANGMSVWNVPDDRVDAVGARVGFLDFVSHCYRRPRQPPAWPYNLFAMVHGRDRAEVEEKVRAIALLVGGDDRGHDVLYSSRILKKTGLRLSTNGETPCSG